MRKVGFIGTIVLEGAVGAFGVSFLAHLYFAFSKPQMLSDGQYGMIFMVTVPIGWLLGSVVGAGSAYRHKDESQPRHAGWKTVGLVMGGCLAGPFVALSAMPLIWLLIVAPIELLTRLFR
jgi:hypothetical protein